MSTKTMDTAKPVEKSLYTMVEKASLGTIVGNYSYFAVFKKHSLRRQFLLYPFHYHFLWRLLL